jgi:hypothetical protein
MTPKPNIHDGNEDRPDLDFDPDFVYVVSNEEIAQKSRNDSLQIKTEDKRWKRNQYLASLAGLYVHISCKCTSACA